MRKIDFTVSKQVDRTAISYQLIASDVYDDRVKEKAAGVPTLAPFDFVDEDGKRTVISYVEETTTLESIYKRYLGKKEVLTLMNGIAATFEAGSKGIPVSYLIKMPNQIYVNPDNYSVRFLLLPLKQDTIALAEISGFFREVLSNLRFAEEPAGDYVARMLNIINGDDFTATKLKGFVDSELAAMGVYISKTADWQVFL